MDAHAAQWIGQRPRQEDAYGVRHFPEGSLVVVCDGMGGHSLGATAAKTAAEAFVESFADSGAAAELIGLTQRMHAALAAANESVGQLYEGTNEYGGTTLLAAYVSRGVLRWVSVGDSCLYLWRRDSLRRLNEDHSMRAVYEKFVCPGGMTLKEAHKGGHVLRSAVTGEDIPLVDAHEKPFPLLPGDRIILSTDGLDALLEQGVLPASVRRVLAKRGGSLAAELVEACRAAADGDADNVTVVTLDV